MTPEQRDAIRIALVHLIMASVKDPTLEKTIKILKNTPQMVQIKRRFHSKEV
jgi:hypothetical protein